MSDDRPAWSHAALHSLAERYRGRLALLVERWATVRVRLTDVRAEDDALIVHYEVVETRGFKTTAPSDNPLSLHARELIATESVLYAGHPYVRLFFDPAIIARAVEIVAPLPDGKTVEEDSIVRAPRPGSKFAVIHAPGPVASALQTFIREQTEAGYGGDDLLRPWTDRD
jgi:hypothetical protein